MSGIAFTDPGLVGITSASTLTPNLVPSVGTAFTSNVYAINALGGFTVEQGFNLLTIGNENQIYKYDVTNALQITLPASLLNTKIGAYNETTESFEHEYIQVSVGDIHNQNFDATNVLSVGSLNTLYSNFDSYVSAYFNNFGGGFETLFSNAVDFSANHGVFGKEQLAALFNGTDQQSEGWTSAFINELDGSMNLNNVSAYLRTAVDSNCFNNRPLASSPGVEVGFLPNDLIILTHGFTVTLSVAVQDEYYLSPLNNNGPTNVATSTQDSAFTTNTGSNPADKLIALNYSETSSATTELIKRTVTVPLLIVLV